MAFLGCRYALDVNVERPEDVLTHKRLLQLAHDPANRPVLDVRLVQVKLRGLIMPYENVIFDCSYFCFDSFW